jgi:hypothetical protein
MDIMGFASFLAAGLSSEGGVLATEVLVSGWRRLETAQQRAKS